LPPLEYLIPSLVFLLLSLSVHEAAHAWTADRLGDTTARLLGRITLNPLAHIDWIGTVLFPIVAYMTGLPLIGWAKPVPVTLQNLQSPRRDFAAIALAGPISNLVLAGIGALILMIGLDRSSVAGNLLVFAAQMNISLAIFNMIPVPPLDGGNVLAGFVPESAARLLDGMREWGFILLYVLVLTGALRVVMGPVAESVMRVFGVYP
jgi:Zn-dependent protease